MITQKSPGPAQARRWHRRPGRSRRPGTAGVCRPPPRPAPARGASLQAAAGGALHKGKAVKGTRKGTGKGSGESMMTSVRTSGGQCELTKHVRTSVGQCESTTSVGGTSAGRTAIR